MRRFIATLITLISSHVLGDTPKVVTIDFGDLRKMPYDLESSALASSTFGEAVFGRLVTVDDDFALKPGLLKRFHYDREMKGYVLELRDDVKFQNGRPVKSADLEFSLLRGFFSKKKNFYRIFLSNIAGAEKVAPGTPFRSGAVEGVKVLDDSKVIVYLRAPNPSFLHSLGNLICSLVPREELGPDLFTWKKWPVGAGAFRVVRVYKSKYSVELAPVAGQGPHFELRFSKSRKNADIAFEKRRGLEQRKFSFPSAVALFAFTNNNLAAKDRDLRLSIAHAVDRKQFVIDGFTEATQLLPPSFWGRVEKLGPAKVDSPFAAEKSAIRASILNLNETVNSEKAKMKEIAEAAIQKVGSKPEVFFTGKKFSAGDEAAAPVFMGLSFITNYFDPLILFSALGIGSPLENLVIKDDQKFNDLLEKAKHAEDFESRLKSVQELSNYVVREAYVIPLGYQYASVYFNPERIAALGELDQPELLHLEQVRLK